MDDEPTDTSAVREEASAGPSSSADGRPPLWNVSSQRKVSRLYLYTTLSLQKIIEVVHRKSQDSDPQTDSANSMLNNLLSKEPRWLHPGRDHDARTADEPEPPTDSALMSSPSTAARLNQVLDRNAASGSKWCPEATDPQAKSWVHHTAAALSGQWSSPSTDGFLPQQGPILEASSNSGNCDGQSTTDEDQNDVETRRSLTGQDLEDISVVTRRRPSEGDRVLVAYLDHGRDPEISSQGAEFNKSPVARPYEDGMSDTDGSLGDLESILSETPSLASSVSSVASIQGTAIRDLKTLLLSHEDLKDLYPLALIRVGPEKFQRNLQRLLTQYGRALRSEAVEPEQSQVAAFVRRSARRVAAEIKGVVFFNSDEHDQPQRFDNKSSSDGESDPDEDDQPQIFETAKNFLISSQAFVEFRFRLKEWLSITVVQSGPLKEEDIDEALSDNPSACKLLEEEPDSQSHRLVDGRLPSPLSAVADIYWDHRLNSGKPYTYHYDLWTLLFLFGMVSLWSTMLTSGFYYELLLISVVLTVVFYRIGLSIIVIAAAYSHVVSTICQRVRNTLSDYFQPKVTPGRVRISWTCRCGKRLHMTTSSRHKAAAISFVQQTAETHHPQRILISSSDDDSLSTSTSTLASNRRDSSEARSTVASSNTSISAETVDNPAPFLPAGTKKYLLLCAKTGTRLIGMKNVDITDMTSEEDVFNKLKKEYHELHKSRWYNFVVKPKTMHYVKFQLLSLKKSKECVGNYITNSIPSIKEVMCQEYAFSPCPPPYGDVPIPPDIFMHIFLNPGDHLGCMATEMLPKKLHHELHWDENMNNATNIPYGWGFYIVEGIDWTLAGWCIIGLIAILSAITIAWSALTSDVQSATGAGSFCMAVMAVLISIVVLRSNASPSTP